MAEHPFLAGDFNLPWSKMTYDHLEPDVDFAIEDGNEKLQQIKKLKDEELTFDSVFRAFDHATEILDRVWERASHLMAVMDNKDMREAFSKVQPKVVSFLTQVFFDKELFEVIRKASEVCLKQNIPNDHKRYIQNVLSDFKDEGAFLGDDKKKRFQEISLRLSAINQKFNENCNDSRNKYELYIKNAAELEGMPVQDLQAAATDAENHGHPGEYRLTLQYPSYMAVMKYVKNEEIRKTIYIEYTKLGTDKYDNEPLIWETLDLRQEKAELLGFPNYGDYITSRRMTKNSKTAIDFEHKIHELVKGKHLEEFETLKQFKVEKTGNSNFDRWDVNYWAEQLKEAKYSYSEADLKPYFECNASLGGVFKVVETLFSVDVKERPTFYGDAPHSEDAIETWAPNVKFYEAFDKESGKRLGGFFADWYARDSKRSGAWNTTLGSKQLGVVCASFSLPTETTPSLLSHYDLSTIFHEFGHCLHSLVYSGDILSLHGHSVSWDFIEVPSQFMENFTYEREVLDMFARHYKTGETIPEELFQKLVAAKNFRAASYIDRQIMFGTADLEIHVNLPKYKGRSLEEVTNEITKDIDEPCPTKRLSFMRSFTHVFSGGYACGYYGYMWSESIEHDLFTKFKKEGVLNPSVGKDFRDKILAMGDMKEPSQLFVDFMGREPDFNALLVAYGLDK